MTDKLSEFRAALSDLINAVAREARSSGARLTDATKAGETAYSKVLALFTAQVESAEREAEDHGTTLCELTEAQHALALLAPLLEGHGVLSLPEVRHAVTKAEKDQAEARAGDKRARALLAARRAEKTP
jgi:multidrug resistance efflux pump